MDKHLASKEYCLRYWRLANSLRKPLKSEQNKRVLQEMTALQKEWKLIYG